MNQRSNIRPGSPVFGKGRLLGAMLKGNMADVVSCGTADNKADVRTNSLVQIPPSCSPRFASFRSLILCELSPLISKDPPRGGLISPWRFVIASRPPCVPLERVRKGMWSKT